MIDVDLYSDTQTRPSRAMRAFMCDAEVGDEQRGEGEVPLEDEQGADEERDRQHGGQRVGDGLGADVRCGEREVGAPPLGLGDAPVQAAKLVGL